MPIESLFVFGTNAENLKEIIKTLKEEKQDKSLGEAFYYWGARAFEINSLFTHDLKERLEKHNQGKVKSTRDRQPLNLTYYEAFLNQQDATHRESYQKTTYGKRYIKNRLKNYFTG